MEWSSRGQTDSRFLSCVDSLVGLHVDFLNEGLAAELARELLLLEVNLLVALSEIVPSDVTYTY